MSRLLFGGVPSRESDAGPTYHSHDDPSWMDHLDDVIEHAREAQREQSLVKKLRLIQEARHALDAAEEAL